MYDSKPYFYGTGRRKNSVARVRVYPGTGAITINGRDIDKLLWPGDFEAHRPPAPGAD